MTKTELKASWENILALMEKKTDRLVADTFFRPLTPSKLSEKEQKLFLLAPKGSESAFYQNMVNNHQENLMECISAVLGKPYFAEVVESEIPEDQEDPYIAEDTLNPRYTFESFVAGPNNRMAYAASVSVAESYSRKYNPLFIYSGSGLGKTHLMHAIGHYVRQKRPRKKVLYVSAETFTAELIEAIRTKQQQAFKDKYRKVDYLLFDDVQFIAAGNKAVEDELFNTFEALYNSNSQLVFTSDRPPKELNGLPERLISRFSWGLSVDIQPPSFETRLAILQNKAILEGLDIKDPDLNAVMEVIAHGVESNIRELEGSFNRVLAHSVLVGEKINLPLAMIVLTDVLNTKESEITPADIKKAVSNYFKIKVSEMESPKRARSVAYPRQIAIYLIREMCPNYSFPKIGEIFGGRDHTTILHSYEKICDEMDMSQDVRNVVENIRSNITL